jgi:serine/threonine-protein kinase RsbW
MRIPSTYEAARSVEDTVLRELDRHGYDQVSTFAVKLALEESLNNAIKHGNGLDPEKIVDVDYDVNGQRVRIIVADQGSGFDPASVPDPTADENLDKPCGRGILLMRAYMDEVCFSPCGSRVKMIKCKN